MAIYSAMRGTHPRSERGRRAAKPAYSPMYAGAKELADILWEQVMEMVEVLAPDTPADAVEMDPYDQWNVLEALAADFSPGYWDDPEALSDLYRLRKQFQGYDDEELKILARYARQKQRLTPDLRVTPANPEFEKTQRRLGVS